MKPKKCETQEVMKIGDWAYWQPVNAFCLFFGPTPVSSGTEPSAAGPVYLVGSVIGDWATVRALGGTVRASLQRA